MKYLLLFFCTNFYGQVLHHQMISSQGKSASLPNGILIKQTIGQQSVSGNSTGEYIIVQGFQQNYWSTILANTPIKSDVVVTAYPNPFISNINFEFSKPITSELSIVIFDVSGHLIFEQKQNVKDNVVTVDLSVLPRSVYLVRLKNNEINYFIKIAKSL